ncbi:hypothetical protein ABID97_003615 [Variovorax sp. OAS795]|uniref:hypothetical protein n=1 Tax=Variovorax sp. OAS795 TaxID=3034231 RepID=UPI003398C3A7
MDARIRPQFFAEVDKACGGSHGQLFPETQVGALSSYEGAVCTPLEQRFLELARAACLQRPGAPEIAECAKRELLRQMVESGIEHMAAAVRQHAGANQARQLRACLVQHQAGCTIELGRQQPPKKPLGKALLDMEIPLP